MVSPSFQIWPSPPKRYFLEQEWQFFESNPIFPKPYPNEEVARYANNGALSPDLSYIIPTRHDGENYVFSLLFSYMDPPIGVILQEGQNYNPYLIGGAISMAQTVFDEVLEFQDGTPATASQMVKDMVAFLKWTTESEYDERKKMLLFTFLIGTLRYLLRFRWSTMRTRSIQFKPKK